MSDFNKPKKISFSTETRDLMPEMKDIPEDFKKDYGPQKKWLDFQSDWFNFGLKSIQAKPKTGVDTKDALRHLAEIQGSFEPTHEHKQAAVAYLASLWFEDVKYELAKKP